MAKKRIREEKVNGEPVFTRHDVDELVEEAKNATQSIYYDALLKIQSECTDLRSKNDFLMCRLETLERELAKAKSNRDATTKALNSARSSMVNVLKENYVFPASPLGIIKMIDFLVGKMVPGILSSFASCLKTSNHQNAFDFDKLSSFDITTFLAAQCQCGIPDFDEFLKSNELKVPPANNMDEYFLDSSLAIYFITKLVSKATSAQHQPSHHPVAAAAVVGEKASMGIVGEKHSSSGEITPCSLRLIYFLSNVYSHIDPAYVCMLSVGTQVVVRSLTQSRATVDFIYHLLPGAVSDSYLKHHAKRAVSNVPELRDLIYKGRNNCVFVLDNNGKYDVGQCESTGANADNKLTISIWTNVSVTTLSDDPSSSGNDNALSLQTQPQYSPTLWKPFTNCPSDLLQFGSASIPTIQYGRQVRHSDIFDNAFRIHGTEVFDNRSSILLDLREVSFGFRASGQSHRKVLDRMCLGCRLLWDESNVKLPCVCGSTKYTTLISHSKGTTFLQPTKPNKVSNDTKSFSFLQPKSLDSSSTTNKMSVTHRTLSSEFSSLSCPTLQSHSSPAPRADVNDARQPTFIASSNFVVKDDPCEGNPHSERIKAIYEPLPAVLVNPGSKDSMRYNSEQIGCYSNVVGFLSSEERLAKEKLGSCVRVYVDVHTDAGAAYTPDPTSDPRYLSVVYWLGLWHALKNALQLVMKLVKLYNVSDLLKKWGWETEKSHNLMYSCSRCRKSNSFILDGLLPAMWHALLYEFNEVHKYTGFSKPDGTPLTVEDFVAFIRDPTYHDATSNNFIELFNVLLVYKIMYDGGKCNNLSMYDCARIYLLPLMFTCNHRLYAPLHTNELVRLHHQVHPDVREHHAKYFTLNGKAWDERIEEQNGQQKVLMSNKAPTEFTVKETSLIVRSADFVRSNMEAQLNVKRRIGRERSHVSHEDQVQHLAMYLVSHGCFSNQGRSYISSFDASHSMKNDLSMANLFRHGKLARDAFFHKWRTSGEQPKFPTPMDAFA